VLCISWSAIFVKLAGISGFGSAFYRMAFGLVAIFPIWLRFRKPIADWHGVKIALLCGIFFACDIALWNTSIMLTKASISTLLGNMAPVWVGLGAVFILKERPGRIFWTGTAITLVGVAIVVGLDKLSATDFSFGNFLSIAASMFYGAYLLITRKGRNTLDTFSFTMLSMVSSTVALGLLCLFTKVPMWGFSAPTWWSLAALGIVPQMLGWLAINFALAYIKPTVASVTLLSQSILTAIFSIPVLGEFMSVREMVGALIALIGIYLVNTKR
jgi:EamA-like transporter family.